MKYKFLKLILFLSIYVTNSYAQLNINWANKISCATGGDDFTAAITGDGNGNIISVGSYQGNVDMDPSAATLYMSTKGSSDIYMIKYDSTGALLWAKSIGGAINDSPYDVIADATGNIYITGFCSALSDFDGGSDTNFVKPIGAANTTVIFLAKYDSTGNFIWANLMNGPGSGWGKKMKFDSNGDLILAGNFAGTIDFDPSVAVSNVVAASTNFSDIFISKYSPNGNLIWVNRIGGSVYDEVNGLTLDSNDNFYITGYMNQTVDFDPGSGTYNLIQPINNQAGFVAKYTNQGAFVWASLFGEEGNDLAIDAYGKLRVAGYFINNFSNEEVTLRQYTLAGVYESYLDFTNSGSERIFIAADSTIYLGGPLYNLTLPNRQDIYLRKIGKNNVTVYEKRFGAQGGFYDDELHALYVDPSGKVFIGGFFQKTVDFDTSPTVTANLSSGLLTSSFVAAYKQNGDYRWASIIEDNKIGYHNKSINTQHIDKSGNVYLGGSFYGAIGFDPYAQNSYIKSGTFANPNSFICKYGPNSQLKWAFSYFSQNNDNELNSIATDTEQNVYVTGAFEGAVDFDPGADTTTLTSNPNSLSNIYLAKYDSTGKFLWVKNIGGTDIDEGHKISIHGAKIYVTGIFNGNVDFDPSAGTNILSSTTSKAFIAVYDLNGNYILAKSFTGNYASITIHNSGQLILTGTATSASDFDFGPATVGVSTSIYNSGFVASYDSLLNYQWAVGVPSASKCRLDSVGNIFLSGNTGGFSSFYSTNATSQGISTNNSHNIYQYYLAKYTAAGILTWAKSTSYSATNMSDFGYDFALDKKSNIYVTGQLKDTVDFDFNAGTNILIPFSVTNPDAFIASYNANGDLNWVKTKQEFSSQSFYNISIQNDNLYAIISTAEGYNLDFNAGGSFLIGESTYLTKYKLSCLNASQITSVTPASICGSGSLTLTVTTSSGTANWYSTSTSSAVLYSGNSFVTPNLSASKTYYVTVPSGVCTSGRTPVTATINSVPSITSGGIYYRCDPGTGTINALASAGTIHWYDALTGGNLLNTGSTYSVPFTSVTTNFYVEATANGCTTATRKLHTFQIIRTPILLSYAGGTGCANSQILLSASVDSGNVQWQTASGAWLWSYPNYNVTVNSTTTFYVVGINSGCSTTPVAVTATVVPTPTFASTTPASKCDSGILTLSVAPNPSTATVNWYDQSVFGTSLGSGTTFTTPFLTNTTTYYAEVSNNGCTNSIRSALNATINPLPFVGVSNSASTLTALLTGANYQWLNCSNYSQISGAILQSYTATSNGNYAVVISQNGCSDTSNCISIINASMPEGDGLAGTLKISPNPFTDWIEINAAQLKSNSSISILDAIGRIIYSEENFMLTNSTRIATGDWPTGIYFLRIKSDKETKVIKLKKAE